MAPTRQDIGKLLKIKKISNFLNKGKVLNEYIKLKCKESILITISNLNHNDVIIPYYAMS